MKKPKNILSGSKGPSLKATTKARPKKVAPLAKAGSHGKRVKRELGNIASMVVEGMPSQSRLANLGKYAHEKKRK